MNKKLVYIFVFLVAGLFVISACQQEVGRKVSKVTVNDNGKIQRVNDVGVQQVYDIAQAEQLELVRPVVPNPNNPEIQWVIGLQCGGIINEELIEENGGDRDFVLVEDLNCEGNGIIIDADNVNLVCNGHRITGPADQVNDTYGIYAERVNGISILGCEISDFNSGIGFNSVMRSNLIDNTLRNNIEYYIDQYNSRGGNGIRLHQSESNILRENQVNNNRATGIYLFRSHSNIIRNNVVSNNRNSGIFILGGNVNNLTRNIVNNNLVGVGMIGVYRDISTTLIENTINDNTQSGIGMGSRSSIILTGNIINGNGEGLNVRGGGNVITNQNQEFICNFL